MLIHSKQQWNMDVIMDIRLRKLVYGIIIPIVFKPVSGTFSYLAFAKASLILSNGKTHSPSNWITT